jgi:hypothetical protein
MRTLRGRREENPKESTPGIDSSDCCGSAGDAGEGILPVRPGFRLFAAIQSPGAVSSQRLQFAPEWNICTVMAHALLLPASPPAPGLSARWESKPFSLVKLACPSADDEPGSKLATQLLFDL